MSLSCGYQIVHGKCEPAIERDEARDDLATLRSALADVFAHKAAARRPIRCDQNDARRDWATCIEPAVALVLTPETADGWRCACERHAAVIEKGGRPVIRVVPERVAR